MGSRVVAGLALPALTLTGCGLVDAPNCTLVGAESGVHVAWTMSDFPKDARFRLCSGKTCKERIGVPHERMAGVGITLPDDIGAASVPVRFTVASADGSRTLYARETTVRLERYAPNGEGCDPVVWTAALRAAPETDLVPVDRDAP
ncbi:hypothetical protein [Streptomyces sp. NPDC026673]|uniref:hypothetical protein n=1 Tax=Streptomyces sp. NPDC026673 TaxID=3155724 RepID=UPI003409C4B2